MQRKVLLAVGLANAMAISLLCSCSSSSPNGGTAPSSPTPASSSADVQPQSPVAVIDPCSKFSAADAQAITGVPMQLSPGHGSIVCMYDEASPKPGADMLRVSLTLSVRKSAAEEDRSWNNTRVIRRLKPGEKNIIQLSGIGDEAWFDGHIEKGKVGVGGVLARKGASDFALESATFSYRSSADEIKKIAKRIAEGLN
ncbi:MAG TPA: hypothetical protein VFT65_12870 [Candidatus Angelobacter sp.]|nr:hypothetical protein [Candidatus Angelobacter sp.]